LQKKKDEKQKRLKERGKKLKQLIRPKWSVKLQKPKNFVSNRKKKPPPLKLKESELNKRRQLQRRNVLESQRKLNKSVWLKLKLQKLPLLLKRIGCVRKKRNAREGRKQKNSSTRRKSWRRRLLNWQYPMKLKHL